MIKKFLLSLALVLSSCAQQKHEIDFPALVTQAERYQLPKPPKNAKLILANTGSTTTTTTANRSSDLDPSIYESGFFLKSNPGGTAQVMTGFHQSLSEPRRKHQPATLPFSATPTKAKPGRYVFRGHSQASFSTAIQCARLGDLKNAQALADLYLNSEYNDGFHAQESSGHYKQEIPLLLARITYAFYYQNLRQKDADLKQALAMLEQLQKEFPALFSDDPEAYYEKSRSDFLKDLRLTVNSPPPKKDSIEDLLFQVAFSDVASHMRTPKHPIYKIYFQGIDAIPELVRLSTNRKLTPAIDPAIMNASERRLRLGDVASLVLEDMVGAHAPQNTYRPLDGLWKTWLKNVDLSDEKSFFLKALSPKKKNSSSSMRFDSGAPIAILLKRHPKDVLTFAKKLSTTKARGDFASALLDCKLDNPTKVTALKSLYQNQKGLDRRYMLQTLAKLDPAAVTREVLPLIKSLPKDVKEPYWTAQEANLTHVIMQLDDPAVWKAYLAKAKTCSIGLRMEFMNPMNYSYIGDKNQNLRLAFLASFLNDKEVRTVNQKDKRWDGPHAGFTYDTLSVQNFVAEKIASILKVPGQPADHWTEKQWTPYRQQVEQALSKLTLPDLS